MINLESNLNFLFTIIIVHDFENSGIVPSSKIIFTVHNISWLQVLPPLVVGRFGFERSNLNAVSLENNFFVVEIIEVGNLNFIVLFLNDLTSRPGDFPIKAFWFEDVNIIPQLKFFSDVIFNVKIVEGLI